MGHFTGRDLQAKLHLGRGGDSAAAAAGGHALLHAVHAAHSGVFCVFGGGQDPLPIVQIGGRPVGHDEVLAGLVAGCQLFDRVEIPPRCGLQNSVVPLEGAVRLHLFGFFVIDPAACVHKAVCPVVSKANETVHVLILALQCLFLGSF